MDSPRCPRQNFRALQADATKFVLGPVPKRRARRGGSVENVPHALGADAGKCVSPARGSFSGRLIRGSLQRAHLRNQDCTRKRPLLHSFLTSPILQVRVSNSKANWNELDSTVRRRHRLLKLCQSFRRTRLLDTVAHSFLIPLRYSSTRGAFYGRKHHGKRLH